MKSIFIITLQIFLISSTLAQTGDDSNFELVCNESEPFCFLKAIDSINEHINEEPSYANNSCVEKFPPQIKQPKYCQNFYKYACSNSNELREKQQNAYADSFLSFLEQLKYVAPQSPAKELSDAFNRGATDVETEALVEPLLVWMQQEENIPTILRAHDRLYELSLRNAQVTEEQLISEFKKLKSSLSEIIQSYPLEESEKLKLVSAANNSYLLLKPTHIVKGLQEFFTSNKELLGMDEDISLVDTYKYFYREKCGATGRNPQASSIMVPNVKAPILYCPAFYSQYSNIDLKGDDFLGALSFITAHEIGHQIYETNRDLFSSLEQCYKGDIGVAAYDNIPTGEREKLWISKGKEIASDIFGVASLVKQIRKNKLSSVEASEFVKGSISLFCLQEEEEIIDSTHPSRYTRIEMISRDPDLRMLMGCNPPTESTPACTINGRQP